MAERFAFSSSRARSSMKNDHESVLNGVDVVQMAWLNTCYIRHSQENEDFMSYSIKSTFPSIPFYTEG